MSKIKDLTGQTFGRWTVIKDSGERKNRQVLWLCECSCEKHTQKKVVGSYLRNGSSQSCGCLAKEKTSIKNRNNLINQKFGKLTALYPLEDVRTNHGGIIWHCSCECGGSKDVSRSSLVTENTTSCGCTKSKGEDLIKRIFLNNQIAFESQKTFDTCCFKDTKGKAIFDFYLLDYNCCIEYDGIGHFQQVSNWDFEKQKERDEYKNQWCKDNNITLIRIPYTHYNNLCLEDLLPETSRFIV